MPWSLVLPSTLLYCPLTSPLGFLAAYTKPLKLPRAQSQRRQTIIHNEAEAQGQRENPVTTETHDLELAKRRIASLEQEALGRHGEDSTAAQAARQVFTPSRVVLSIFSSYELLKNRSEKIIKSATAMHDKSIRKDDAYDKYRSIWFRLGITAD